MQSDSNLHSQASTLTSKSRSLGVKDRERDLGTSHIWPICLSAGVDLNSFCVRMTLCRQARIQFNLGSIASNVWEAYLHRGPQRNSCFTRLRTFYLRPPWATFWSAWGAQKAVAAAQLRPMLGVSGAAYWITFPKRSNVTMVDWRNDRINVITKCYIKDVAM